MQTHLSRPALLGMLAGAALISFSAVFTRIAEVPPTVSAFYRMAFGAGFLALYMLWRGGAGRALGAFWHLSAWVAAACFAADLYLWHRAIHLVGPGLATILANFQVFLMAAVGAIWLGEKLSARFGLGLAFAMAGLWLLVGVSWTAMGEDFRSGVMFGLATSLAYAAYILTMRWSQRRTGRLSAEHLLYLVTVLCALILAVMVVAEDHSFAIPDLRSLLALLAYGLVAQVVGWLLIVRSMPGLPASLVGLILLLQPSLSFIWDMLFFARPTSTLDLVGVGLALGGIYLGSQRGTRPALPPAAQA